MTPFIAGVLFGGILVAAMFAAFLTKPLRTKREIEAWSEDAYQPPVTTRVLIKERELQL